MEGRTIDHLASQSRGTYIVAGAQVGMLIMFRTLQASRARSEPRSGCRMIHSGWFRARWRDTISHTAYAFTLPHCCSWIFMLTSLITRSLASWAGALMRASVFLASRSHGHATAIAQVSSARCVYHAGLPARTLSELPRKTFSRWTRRPRWRRARPSSGVGWRWSAGITPILPSVLSRPSAT